MPELPLSVFELACDQSTIAFKGIFTVFGGRPEFAHLVHGRRGVQLRFDGVFAYKSYDESSDFLLGAATPPPSLKEPVPYGGCWPFAEVRNSAWIDRVVKRDGTREAAEFRHWSIFAINHSLHVMTRAEYPPRFVTWFD